VEDDRTLVLVSAAQLSTGIAGLALALRRRHPYDVPLMHGRRDAIGRQSLLMGTALSAPSAMLATQAIATAVLARRHSAPAARVLGVLGATMVPGYLVERLTRQGLLRGAWDSAELRVTLAGLTLAAGMIPLAARSLAQEPHS
jgi:hypothetical protein